MALDTSLIHIDFEVLGGNNCKVLKVIDESNWPIPPDGLIPISYISILTPGSVKRVNHVFQKEKVNLFNSNNLNLSDVHNYAYLAPLPDGIYTITVERCQDDPNAVTKYHFQDCQIRCALARRIIGIDLTCQPCRKNLLDEILDIQLFLDGAKAQTDKCNPVKAMEYYRRASMLLSRLSEPGDDRNCTNC